MSSLECPKESKTWKLVWTFFTIGCNPKLFFGVPSSYLNEKMSWDIACNNKISLLNEFFGIFVLVSIESRTCHKTYFRLIMLLSSMCFMVCLIWSRKCFLRHEFIGFGTIMIRRIKWPDLVYNQIVCIRKCLGTLRWMIWLLPWMSYSVFVQTTSMRKCLGTFLTRIWPLSIMSSLVYFELPSLVNVFETFLTR